MRIVEFKRQARAALRGGFWPALLVCLVAIALGGIAVDSLAHEPFTLHGILQRLVTDGSPAQTLVLLTAFQLVLAGPLAVGRARYFLQAAQGENDIRNIFFAFRPRHYVNIAFGQFLAMLIIVLVFVAPQVALILWAGGWFWPIRLVASISLIIPGIFTFYRFRLMPFIQANEPNLPAVDALIKCSRSSVGLRKEICKVDLSFLGWYIVMPLTLGVGVFFVLPYHHATLAQYFLGLNDTLSGIYKPPKRHAPFVDIKEEERLRA